MKLHIDTRRVHRLTLNRQRIRDLGNFTLAHESLTVRAERSGARVVIRVETGQATREMPHKLNVRLHNCRHFPFDMFCPNTPP